jgi:hypothetical protein
LLSSIVCIVCRSWYQPRSPPHTALVQLGAGLPAQHPFTATVPAAGGAQQLFACLPVVRLGAAVHTCRCQSLPCCHLVPPALEVLLSHSSLLVPASCLLLATQVHQYTPDGTVCLACSGAPPQSSCRLPSPDLTCNGLLTCLPGSFFRGAVRSRILTPTPDPLVLRNEQQ